MHTIIVPAAEWENKAEDIVMKAKAGEIILFPTETVYGVGTCASPAGVEKLSALKGRPRGKPFQVMVADLETLEKFGTETGPKAKILMEKFWPGGLTLVLKINPAKVVREIAPNGTIGFRMPDHELCLDIVRRIGGVMLATSANFSGGPEAATCMEAVRFFQNTIYAAVDAGPATGTKPSTVVSVKDNVVTVLREGAIPAAVIMSAVDDEKK